MAELFELELLGGAIERRYRKSRPEVERMPWGTLDASAIPDAILIAERRAWTRAAYQEHRTAVACTAALRALIEVRAPLDLVAMASRFPLDELVHVELCAKMAMELGGGTEILHDPDDLTRDPDPALSPMLRAAEMVTRVFCVGEAYSVPLLRGQWHAARHPLPKAILGRIVKDEAAHGAFGFTFLDWVLERLSAEDLAHLGAQADTVIRAIYRQWMGIGRRRGAAAVPQAVAWMETDAYLALAMQSMQENVIDPLEERGIPISAQLSAR